MDKLCDAFRTLYNDAYRVFDPDCVIEMREKSQAAFIAYYNEKVKNEPYFQSPLSSTKLSNWLKNGPKGSYDVIYNLELIASSTYVPDYGNYSKSEIIRDINDELESIDSALNRLSTLCDEHGFCSEQATEMMMNLLRMEDKVLISAGSLPLLNDSDYRFNNRGMLTILAGINAKIEKLRANEDNDTGYYAYQFLFNKTMSLTDLIESKAESQEDQIINLIKKHELSSELSNPEQIKMVEDLLVSMLEKKY